MRWWKCSICGNEYKAVIRARVHGLQCPVCAERAVLPGYNDLATTDPELVQEWDVELNGGKLPTQISRNSLYSVWWTGSCGHSWKAKVFDRAVEHTGCIYCEKEFQWHLPRLLVMHYASSYGLEVRLKGEETIGVPLDAYIPELKLAFMFSHKGTQKEKNIQMVIEHLCRKRGIQCECIGAKLSKEEICVAIKQGFCKAHTYIKALLLNKQKTMTIRRITRLWDWFIRLKRRKRNNLILTLPQNPKVIFLRQNKK